MRRMSKTLPHALTSSDAILRFENNFCCSRKGIYAKNTRKLSLRVQIHMMIINRFASVSSRYQNGIFLCLIHDDESKRLKFLPWGFRMENLIPTRSEDSFQEEKKKREITILAWQVQDYITILSILYIGHIRNVHVLLIEDSVAYTISET
ncbi:CLUMA_CG012723, isoform A [Clunio marinus]|uniref:CLUMA_CG012723, isoform A n=1 Tax=Clunio marinus TaxID=568069 RepID=A0A1J1IGG9_9DIPT|nr:CLUMA_CG012723, isoform A [Clunio marinus]